MTKVVSLGIHIVDVHGYPVSEVPPGQGLALLKQVRFTVAGTAAGTSIDMAEDFDQVMKFAQTTKIKTL